MSGLRTVGLFTGPRKVWDGPPYIYIADDLTMAERSRAGKLLDLLWQNCLK